MAGKKHFPATESPIVAFVRKYCDQMREAVEKRLADVTGYLTGALEQLMLQQGQMMTVQAAILQFLDEQVAPGAEAQIRIIVETNIAKMKADREAREKAAAEEAAKRAAEGPPTLTLVEDGTLEAAAPADIAPEAPVDAPADTPGSA